LYPAVLKEYLAILGAAPNPIFVEGFDDPDEPLPTVPGVKEHDIEREVSSHRLLDQIRC
jgi:hypothetical protein